MIIKNAVFLLHIISISSASYSADAFTFQKTPTLSASKNVAMLQKPNLSSRFASFHRPTSCLRSTKEQDFPDTDVNGKRFERTAESDISLDKPCVMKIGDGYYDMTGWAKAHPGGAKVLEKFHNKDATKAFYNVGHSKQAEEMLSDFLVDPPSDVTIESEKTVVVPATETKPVPRWRKKLFTHEDPIGIHKYMGIFCLLHFIYRFGKATFGDVAAGFGYRQGLGSSVFPLLCLIPHTMLAMSSLIFETVPRERVVGRPMIWKEFRVHSIIFALRGILCTFLASLAIMKPSLRKICLAGSMISVFLGLVLSDVATAKLKPYETSGTTATMPYWDGCTKDTMKRIKTFYAYAQFSATLGCVIGNNPLLPFISVMPIQIAAFLLTLVRKGLISGRAYHIGYTFTLIYPFFTFFRSFQLMKSPLEGPLYLIGSAFLFKLRTTGLNKYLLWLPVLAARLTPFGDSLLTYGVF